MLTRSAPESRPARRHGHQRAWQFAVAVVASWGAIVASQATGHASILHHDSIVAARRPVLAVLLFVVAWQAMVGAMMLPSTWPMISLVREATPEAERRHRMPPFVGAYFAVWTAFGLAALGLDVGVHRIVDASRYLTDHDYFVAATALALAGVFQFTPWRVQCMRTCRHPFGFLMHHRSDSPFRLGLRHALFCIGCCWALMLLMFGVGLTNLMWMGALTGVMVYEKAGRRGETIARFSGAVLLLWATFVAVHPTWLPHALAGPA